MASHINTRSWRLAIAVSTGTRLASLDGIQRNRRLRRTELRKKAHARSSWEITEETLGLPIGAVRWPAWSTSHRPKDICIWRCPRRSQVSDPSPVASIVERSRWSPAASVGSNWER